MLLVVLVFILAFAAGYASGRFRWPARRSRPTPVGSVTESAPPKPIETRAFDPIALRGTAEWTDAMAKLGERYAASGVGGVVFVHGTFAGTDPLSAYGVVERVLPAAVGPVLARMLREKTRVYLDRILGDVGNFGRDYVRVFEAALGARIPCTEFVWSSENHHVGRLEGALGLLRVLATHAELGVEHPERRLLVIGHSHAGQVFALVTQLLARSIATEAIVDIARARALDVATLEADRDTLASCRLDFVTFGAPARYAWANHAHTRALHVLSAESDWIRRLGVAGSDFPALAKGDRRINRALAESLGPGFSPVSFAAALRSGLGLPASGEVLLVDYGNGVVANGLGHGTYTRLDAMLFHAKLIADRLYDSAPEPLALRA